MATVRRFRLTARDEEMMRRAIQLARQNLGRTSPNPSVGCVIADDSGIVAEAVTAPGGRPHAETLALAAAGSRARGATVYLTLEPCAHHGKTPPCADALVKAGVKRVVVGCIDPYPPVRGRGLRRLRQAGVEVVVGGLEDECKRVNEGFITRVTKGRPFILLKLAMTLDGKIASCTGDSRWVSSPKSRELVHQWRNEYDAVMVGTNTVLHDDPRLTCRIPGGRDPLRVILDTNLRTSPQARVFTQPSKASTLLVTSKRNRDLARRRYGSARVEIIGAPTRRGQIALGPLMKLLAERGICKLLIEGGAHLAGSALAEGIVDRVAFFVAPKILGSGLSAVEGLSRRTMRQAIKLANLRVSELGQDWLFEGEPVVR